MEVDMLLVEEARAEMPEGDTCLLSPVGEAAGIWVSILIVGVAGTDKAAMVKSRLGWLDDMTAEEAELRLGACLAGLRIAFGDSRVTAYEDGSELMLATIRVFPDSEIAANAMAILRSTVGPGSGALN